MAFSYQVRTRLRPHRQLRETQRVLNLSKKPLTRPAAVDEGTAAGHPLPKGEGYSSNW